MNISHDVDFYYTKGQFYGTKKKKNYKKEKKD